MNTSARSETLEGPRGAGRIPALAFGALVVAVVTMLVIGSQGRWFLALLVPVAVFTLYVAVRVATVMVAEIRAGRADESEE